MYLYVTHTTAFFGVGFRQASTGIGARHTDDAITRHYPRLSTAVQGFDPSMRQWLSNRVTPPWSRTRSWLARLPEARLAITRTSSRRSLTIPPPLESNGVGGQEVGTE